MAIEVQVRGNNVEKAMRVLKKKLMKDGLMKELRERQYYEKPSLKNAPSNYAVIGRYILPKKIFKVLQHQKPGKNGEIHITDSIRNLVLKGNDSIIIPLMCIMCVAIPFVLITLAPRYISAAEVNLFFLLETILGPLWVWLVIKEQPSFETILGGSVIVVTIATPKPARFSGKLSLP